MRRLDAKTLVQSGPSEPGPGAPLRLKPLAFSLGPNVEGVTNVLGGIPVSSGSLFPGGTTRQHDGSYYVDYVHGKTSTHAVVRGRRLGSLGGTVGPEEDLFDGVAIDPSVVTVPELPSIWTWRARTWRRMAWLRSKGASAASASATIAR